MPNPNHDEKGKFTTGGDKGPAGDKVVRTSDTRADDPATSEELHGFVKVREASEHASEVYGDPHGKFEVSKEAGKFKVTRKSRGALSRRKADVVGRYKTLNEAAADLRRIDPYGFGGQR